MDVRTFTASAVATPCVEFSASVLFGWLIHMASRWLQDAYEVQDWLRARHLGLLNNAAEIIAYVGPIPVMVAGGVVGALLIVMLRRLNPPTFAFK